MRTRRAYVTFVFKRAPTQFACATARRVRVVGPQSARSRRDDDDGRRARATLDARATRARSDGARGDRGDRGGVRDDDDDDDDGDGDGDRRGARGVDAGGSVRRATRRRG